jgi:hypothetical protein
VNDDDALSALVMQDIDKIKPSFYKYNSEKDNFDNSISYRHQMHLGVIVDESPDYILGASFDKVDLYGLEAMTLAGVKNNRKEIKEIKNYLGMGQTANVSDFGSITVNGSEMQVNFSDDFAKKITSENLPVVTVTSNNPFVTLSVTEKTSRGFKVVASAAVSNLSIDWIAMAKVKTENSFESAKTNSSQISPFLMERLRVPDATKSMILNNINSTPLSPTASGSGLKFNNSIH